MGKKNVSLCLFLYYINSVAKQKNIIKVQLGYYGMYMKYHSVDNNIIITIIIIMIMH